MMFWVINSLILKFALHSFKMIVGALHPYYLPGA